VACDISPGLLFILYKMNTPGINPIRSEIVSTNRNIPIILPASFLTSSIDGYIVDLSILDISFDDFWVEYKVINTPERIKNPNYTYSVNARCGGGRLGGLEIRLVASFTSHRFTWNLPSTHPKVIHLSLIDNSRNRSIAYRLVSGKCIWPTPGNDCSSSPIGQRPYFSEFDVFGATKVKGSIIYMNIKFIVLLDNMEGRPLNEMRCNGSQLFSTGHPPLPITKALHLYTFSCRFIYLKVDMELATYMNEKIDIKEMINARKARGMIYLESGFEPKEVNDQTWLVPSQTGNGAYTVHYAYQPHIMWTCTCKDYETRGLPCKHIAAVQIWKHLRDRFEQVSLHVHQQIPVKESDLHECKFCHSTNYIRYGSKNGKQVYKCKDCNRKFVDNVDFENMKYNPKIIALTLDLYFRGLSLRKVCQHLKEFYNLGVSYMTVYRWIEKYIGIMNEYVNTLQPEIGDVWHADEMMVGINGNWEYLWNVMDERTRFQLASVVSKERKVHDARVVFQKSKKNIGGRRPKFIVTDGLGAYRGAINKEFTTNHGEVEHLWNVGLQHHPNNNHVERLHGTIRQRSKVMRGLKTEETPIVQGHRLFYNFIKPHEALGGKTPSEEAGISIEGENKWLTLMRTAIEHQKSVEKNTTTKVTPHVCQP
jgi:putative transposase